MTGTLTFFAAALLALVALLVTLLVREMARPPRHTAGYAIARGLPTDPSDLGLEFDEWWLDRPDDARLPVWEITSTSPRAVAATAVFIHGWGHSRIDMLAHTAMWRDRFARLVYFDRRGHGDAEGSLSRLGYREDDDLNALLERLGEGPFVLVGYSMGAVIAIAAASRDYPQKKDIACILAIGPYADFHASLRGRLRRAGQPTRPVTDLAILWYRLLGRSPRSLAADDLRGLNCPLLVLHGDSDIVAPLPQAQWIAKSASRAELLVVRGAGHELSLLAESPEHKDALERCIALVSDPSNRRSVARSTPGTRE